MAGTATVPCCPGPVRRTLQRVRPTVEYRSRRVITARICRESGLKGDPLTGRVSGVNWTRRRTGAVNAPVPCPQGEAHWHRAVDTPRSGIDEEPGDILTVSVEMGRITCPNKSLNARYLSSHCHIHRRWPFLSPASNPGSSVDEKSQMPAHQAA